MYVEVQTLSLLVTIPLGMLIRQWASGCPCLWHTDPSSALVPLNHVLLDVNIYVWGVGVCIQERERGYI